MYLFLTVFLPLVGALGAGLFCRVICKKIASFLTISCMAIATIMAYKVFYDVAIMHNIEHMLLLKWFQVEDIQVSWALYADSLTAVMLIVVTTVSALVHLYSVGYMHDDPHLIRFMSYLSLFTFFMLVLVTGDNFVQLFVGWEGVGLCSYLLIGFWFKKDSANDASMKAFVVNRVGDLSFIVGMAAVLYLFGSLEFANIFNQVESAKEINVNFLGYDLHALTICTMLLFIGAMGKSAQLGLHVWLPDAMEGPTPVSALIHAATMVTAGVFLVVRCSPMYEYTPFVLSVITVIGALTCVFAATIALTQNDIKKVIAYSTCSQLGYMFFACGVSAYSAAIFHLMTHAFFKALLFLGAGSVIHALHHEQDIRKMGGIWKKIPETHAMMWIGSLALAGIFPFAGYYSKDIVLESAFAAHGQYGVFAYWLGILAAFMTAFYSWRLLIKSFYGQTTLSAKELDNVHEPPLVMRIPLYILSIGAIFSGMIGYKLLGMVDYSGDFWNGAIFVLAENNPLEDAHKVSIWIKLMPAIVGVIAIYIAYVMYMLSKQLDKRLSKVVPELYKLLLNKWYIDEIYHCLFVKPILYISQILWKCVDVKFVDAIPNTLAKMSSRIAGYISKLHTGLVYHYMFVMVTGLVMLLTWVVN